MAKIVQMLRWAHLGGSKLQSQNTCGKLDLFPLWARMSGFFRVDEF